MTLILMHSHKGGVGNSFLAAQLALSLVAGGHEVTVLDFTFQDSLKLHLGFSPDQVIPGLPPEAGEPLVAFGIRIRQGYSDIRRPYWREKLLADDDLSVRSNRLYIADVASEDRELLAMLLRHCALHICTLTPTADALATLPRLSDGKPVVALDRTVFVLNKLDDRHRLSRHTESFMRDAFGEQLIGRVRRDEAVNEALARFEPLSRYAPNSAALPDLARFACAVERRLGLASHGNTAEAAE